MKLSLDALKERAEATASMDLLATISGGTDNACHDAIENAPGYQDGVRKHELYNEIGDAISDWWNDLWN